MPANIMEKPNANGSVPSFVVFLYFIVSFHGDANIADLLQQFPAKALGAQAPATPHHLELRGIVLRRTPQLHPPPKFAPPSRAVTRYWGAGAGKFASAILPFARQFDDHKTKSLTRHHSKEGWQGFKRSVNCGQ
jgi:hypothetical protein